MKLQQKIGMYLIYMALLGLIFHALHTISTTVQIFSDQEISLTSDFNTESEPKEDEIEKEDKFKIYDTFSTLALKNKMNSRKFCIPSYYCLSHCAELHTPPPETPIRAIYCYI